MSGLFPARCAWSARLLFCARRDLFVPLYTCNVGCWIRVLKHSQALTIDCAVLVDTCTARIVNNHKVELSIIEYILDTHFGWRRYNSDIRIFWIRLLFSIISFIHLSIPIHIPCSRQYGYNVYIPNQCTAIHTTSNDSFTRVHQYLGNSRTSSCNVTREGEKRKQVFFWSVDLLSV